MAYATHHPEAKVEPAWARLGVLFNCRPVAHTPDLERLLLDTARQLPANPRLYPLAVTWLTRFGKCVAVHRFHQLVRDELETDAQPALGVLIDAAIAHSAPRGLSLAKICRPRTTPRPLFTAYSRFPKIAEETSSSIGRKWGAWTPEVELKPDAIRPAAWLRLKNPSFVERLIRKGDLRLSLLESLRWDQQGRSPSVAHLARATGATRAAVLNALNDLEDEGYAVVEANADGRDRPVVLARAA